MRIDLHIGLDQTCAERMQGVLADKRGNLADKGILFPRGPGPGNHTRLYMAVTDPRHVDPLRFNRGFVTADRQAALRSEVAEDLARDVARHTPDVLILSAWQLGTSLHTVSELERLRDLLAPLSEDINIIAHVDEQARMLTRYYGAQVLEGRCNPLDTELELTESVDWWRSCLDSTPPIDARAGLFLETQGAPFWLDYAALVRFWEGVFGSGRVTLRPCDPTRFAGAEVLDEISQSFGISDNIGKCEATDPPGLPSAAWLTRSRQFNTLLLQLLDQGKRILPRQLWRRMLSDIAVAGNPIAPGSLARISARFEADNAALVARHPHLRAAALRPDPPQEPWREADPTLGFRASQYLLAFLYRIDKANRAERKAKAADLARAKDDTRNRAHLSAALPAKAVENYESLRRSPYAPHNRLGAVNEEELAAAFAPAPPRALRQGSSGNVIVGCMKNEAPYIVEWVAYHRAIGVDKFLIYTNGCTDGTAEILDRLQAMGVLEHRNNDNWKGNSPQQYALNQSLKEKVIRQADWIIHIDVDEFINVRTGNGTLQDFHALVPDATNIAMTWRLFGHNGVTRLADDFVIDQFDTCAPRYCPKPHTVWGYKTMFRNIGAYGKISCHRPSKLDEQHADKVKWVNGSGKDITDEALRNGWRSSRKSIGYDLLQLNHYALRSAESFLIKRQRGRALHVDRSIGLNYWIRMDWGDVCDITIKRNIPRLRAEYDRLMQDKVLSDLHASGMDWHRAKAQELHDMPEFEDLYQQAVALKLNEVERAAYALTLDMES